MTTVVEMGISNAVQVTALAAVVFLMTRILRHAGIRRYLWLLVLLKLLTPPLLSVPLFSMPPSWKASSDVRASATQPTTRSSPVATTLGSPADEQAVTSQAGRTGGFEGLSPPPSASVASRSDARPRVEVAASITTSPAPWSGNEGRSSRWLLAVLAFWLTGSLLWFGTVLYSGGRFGRMLRRSRRAGPEIQLETQRLAAQLGIHRAPEVLVVNANVSPFLWGAGVWGLANRTVIVLPRKLLDEFSESQRFVILAHELTHLARHDLQVRWLEIAAIGLYWWHPIAWIARRELRHAEELCCDSTAISQFSLSSREYARTLLETACLLADHRPSQPQTACGFGAQTSLKRRITMIVKSKLRHRLSWPLRVAVLLLACGVLPLSPFTFGEDDKGPRTAASVETAATSVQATADYVIAGKCRRWLDVNTTVADAEIRLYAVTGLLERSTEIARTVSNAQGGFRFEELERPRRHRLNSLSYYLAVNEKGGPVGVMGVYDPARAEKMRLFIPEQAGALKGRVVDERGEPVVGARLEPNWGVAGIGASQQATTKERGLFLLTGLPIHLNQKGKPFGLTVRITHPDYPTSVVKASEVPSVVTFTVKSGCRVSGVVQDSTRGMPLRNTIVSAIPADVNSGTETQAVTDAEGRYRLNLLQGKYNVILEDESFVAKAVAELECRDGDRIELKPMQASGGGWVTGQFINTETGRPMVFNPRGMRIGLGVFGPSRPQTRLMHEAILATVDDAGRFRIRAAAGENFPFCNVQGARTIWTTRKYPPVVVVEGKEISSVMEFTPERTAEQKMAAAHRILNSLPKEPAGRVDAIIEEFRKLNHTVDECEIWCLLMRELVTIGKPAVLPLCKEFEATDQQRMMRRLAFALRAIGDPRAAPTLIRVLPKTLQPPMSDYGLLVADNELAAFMRKHGGDHRSRGQYFSFRRPVRETHGALTQLTKRNVNVSELSGMSRAKDQRSLARQEAFYYKAASEWAKWWEANWEKFDVDESFGKVNLPPYVPRDLRDYPTGLELTKNATIDNNGKTRMVVTPIGDADRNSDFFLDLDTGASPRWPRDLPHNNRSVEVVTAAREWAAGKGVDLMCVRSEKDGKFTHTLIGIGLQLWEIDPFDAKNIAKRVADGQLPNGRRIKDALLHYDPKTKQNVPRRGSSFLYVTREQGLGVITITDFVTEVRDLTGTPAGAGPRGVGFNRGVRFDYRSIAR